MNHKDHDEAEAFFRHADASWWNPNCGHDNRFWLFRAQTEYVGTQLKKHVPKIDGIRALDAGCGRGIHSQLLDQLGYKVTSFDISPKMLALTGAIVDSTLVEGNLMHMPFADAAFNIVVSIGTSMHVPSVNVLMSEINRVLMPNGIAVISMANKLSLYVLWTTKINHLLADHQILYRRDQFTFWSFRKLLLANHFHVISSAGFAMIPPISLQTGWRKNIINPFTSRLLSLPFDWLLARYFGCGVTFVICKI